MSSLNASGVSDIIGNDSTSAEISIREKAEKTKTVTADERQTIARNVYEILERAKEEGISKSAIAHQMNLGTGEAKELHPYYLPPSRVNRRLIAKAKSYINLLDSLADIEGHSRSGMTSDLLREAFTGTSYWKRDVSGEDVVTVLYNVMRECQEWLLRDKELYEAYDIFYRFVREHPNAEWQEQSAKKIYLAAFQDKHIDFPKNLRPARILIGKSIKEVIKPSGEPLTLFANTPRSCSLFNSTYWYLYLGPNNEGRIEFQLATEKWLSIPEELYEQTRDGVIDRIDDDYNLRAGINLVTSGGRSISLVDENFHDLFEEGQDRIQIKGSEKYTQAFLQSFPDIGVFKCRPKRALQGDLLQLRTLTMDALEDFNRVASYESFKLCAPFGNDLRRPDFELRYGRSLLTQVLTCFLSPCLRIRDAQLIENNFGEKFFRDCIPPGGWIHYDGDESDIGPDSLLSMPDLMWIKSKIFGAVIRKQFREGTNLAEEILQSTLSRFNKGL